MSKVIIEPYLLTFYIKIILTTSQEKHEYAMDSRGVPSYFFPKYKAWTYFLPPISKSDTVLVFETGIGDDILTVAPLASRTIALCANIKIAEAIQSRLAKEQHSCNIAIVVSSPIDLSFKMHSFDFVIARNFFFLWNANRWREKELCGNLLTMLRNTGTLLIGSKDRPVNGFFSYTVNLVKSCITKNFSFHSVVRDQFNAIQNTFFCMPDHMTCEEIISSEWMRDRQNRPFSLRQWIKNAIITHLFPHGCPNANYIVQTSKSPSLIQLILTKASTLIGDAHCILKIHQILIGNPSTIICIVSVGSQEFIIRIPMTPSALARAERQFETLSYLELIFSENNRLRSPKPCQPFKVFKQVVFTEEKLRGEVYETASCFNKFNEDNAVQWLVDFHLATQQVIKDRAVYLHDLIDIPFQKLSSCLRTEQEKKILALLQEEILLGLSSVQFNAVCMHGDYKIENMTFSKENNKVIGVFDWDLSVKFGFPLIDLLYFIAYSDMLKYNNRNISEILLEKFILVNNNNYEREWIRNYSEILGIDMRCMRYFSIISWVYIVVFSAQEEMFSLNDWYSSNIELYLYGCYESQNN